MENALPGQVFSSTNGSTGIYQSIASALWTQQEQVLKPACFVQPSKAEDVAKAIEVLRDFNRPKSNSHGAYTGCQFAIKSGGHTPFPGAANIDQGVTIDLSKLNTIKINSGPKSASIGTGNRWSNVYSILEVAGYTVPGGRDSNVGVGGLVLGGGISFFSPRVGLVCDAVTNFEIVLASGEIVNANATSHKDLFRSLKGGSNNFGVVTKIDLPLQDAKLWGGLLFTGTALRQTAATFFERFASSDRYDPDASLIQSNVFVNGTWLLSLQMTYTDPSATNPAVFQPLISLPGQSTLRSTTHFNLTTELGAGIPPNPRALWITLTTGNNSTLMESIFQLGNATMIALADLAGIFSAISFQPLPQEMIQQGKAHGVNALGLDKSDGDLVIVNVGIFWQGIGDDERVYSAAWDLLQSAIKEAKSKGLWNEYLYLNYALRYNDFEQQVMRSYGAKSNEFLHAVSKKYDPHGLFQRAVPGGFKL